MTLKEITSIGDLNIVFHINQAIIKKHYQNIDNAFKK